MQLDYGKMKQRFRVYFEWLLILLGLAIIAPKQILLTKFNLLVSGIILLLYAAYFTSITKIIILKYRSHKPTVQAA